MKYNTFIAVLLAAALLFALAACGTKQAPAHSGQPDPTTRQTEPQNSSEPSESTESPTHGDEVSEEEAWKKGFEESLFIEFGLTPKYYEDLGGGIYQVYVDRGGQVVPFVTVDSATGDYHG